MQYLNMESVKLGPLGKLAHILTLETFTFHLHYRDFRNNTLTGITTTITDAAEENANVTVRCEACVS